MWIYKITNLLNNKVYIGQTIRTVQSRWRRHILDAKNNKLNTHFARAIRKYGEENFSVEIIDTANSAEELTQKESNYIIKYNSIQDGYNETSSQFKCGGNTYLSKNEQEMSIIRDKIRLTKLGGLNPNSRSIIMIDTVLNKEKCFSSIKECSNYLNLKTTRSIQTRLHNQTKSLLFNKYQFKYKEESVSTIGDECNQVEEEISTSSKQETPDNGDDIVSASGDRG